MWFNDNVVKIVKNWAARNFWRANDEAMKIWKTVYLHISLAYAVPKLANVWDINLIKNEVKANCKYRATVTTARWIGMKICQVSIMVPMIILMRAWQLESMRKLMKTRKPMAINFFYMTFTMHRTAGERGGHFFPSIPFHPLHEQLHSSKAITTEISSLHMVSDRTHG